MIKTQQLSKALDGTTSYLKIVEAALAESEENVRILTVMRSNLQRNILGLNPQGLQKVMNDAGFDTKVEEELKAEFDKK